MNKADQAELEKLQEEYTQLQEKVNNGMKQLQTYETQRSENEMVKEEFSFLESDDVVYKLVGSVLIRSDISEAKMNVDSRLDLINKQIKTIESEVDNNNKKIEEIRSKAVKMQQNAAMKKINQLPKKH